MKVIVLVIKLFLFPDVEEELTYIFPTMEACLMEKADKENSLLGFPIERVEAACEVQDKQTAPPPTVCINLVPNVSCYEP